MRPYGEAINADVRQLIGPPYRQSVAELSLELRIHVITLYKRRKAWRTHGEGTLIDLQPMIASMATLALNPRL